MTPWQNSSINDFILPQKPQNCRLYPQEPLIKIHSNEKAAQDYFDDTRRLQNLFHRYNGTSGILENDFTARNYHNFLPQGPKDKTRSNSDITDTYYLSKHNLVNRRSLSLGADYNCVAKLPSTDKKCKSSFNKMKSEFESQHQKPFPTTAFSDTDNSLDKASVAKSATSEVEDFRTPFGNEDYSTVYDSLHKPCLTYDPGKHRDDRAFYTVRMGILSHATGLNTHSQEMTPILPLRTNANYGRFSQRHYQKTQQNHLYRNQPSIEKHLFWAR